MENKTHWKKQFNYDYLGSYSIDEGKELILTIKETKKEIVTGNAGKKEECFTCYFNESKKPMILNRTNCKTIEALYSPYIEDWTGKKIILYVEKGVKAFGNEVDALRVKNEYPEIIKTELTPNHPKWNNTIGRLKEGVTIDKVKEYYNLSEANQTKIMEAAI